MSRSGYIDDFDDQWHAIMWRGAVASAMRGKRGQAFLKEMLAALDALPEPKLIAKELELNGEVCAIGSVGKARGLDMSSLDPEDYETISGTFRIAEAMAREIMYANDEGTHVRNETPEERFKRIRSWIVKNIKAED
jgi:hypothetical protein